MYYIITSKHQVIRFASLLNSIKKQMWWKLLMKSVTNSEAAFSYLKKCNKQQSEKRNFVFASWFWLLLC